MAKTTNKNPVFKPFSRETGSGFLDGDSACFGYGSVNPESLGIEELEALKTAIIEDIADTDTLIEIQLSEMERKSNPDTQFLANDRRRRQQMMVELRAVKQRIKMVKNMKAEESAA